MIHSDCMSFFPDGRYLVYSGAHQTIPPSDITSTSISRHSQSVCNDFALVPPHLLLLGIRLWLLEQLLAYAQVHPPSRCILGRCSASYPMKSLYFDISSPASLSVCNYSRMHVRLRIFRNKLYMFHIDIKFLPCAIVNATVSCCCLQYPLTEQGIAGFGIGLASMGHTAVAEIQFADYIFPAFDQLVNEAAKFRYRSGGHFSIGRLTSPEWFFMGASGLKVVIPRSPIQCKGLLSAIRDPNPVIFMEPKVLYRSAVEQSIDDFALALSRAEILIPGSDLTLLTWGTPVYHYEAALRLLNSPPPSLTPLIPPSLRSAKVEHIYLWTILPWDIETVVESVRRTKRLVIVHEAGMTGGVGGEIAAEVGKRAFLRLEAPVRRITGWGVPAVLQLEKFNMPDAVRILDGILETLSY
ncbi:hypothetical protein EDB19DRAFT_2024506 [Suillus lakei]|nr:hypothetical protein EDB19DRAFT_2024506 [Suillus lakei]